MFAVEAISTSKDVWDYLIANYEKATATNIVYVWRELINMCLDEEGVVEDFIVKYERLVARFAGFGKPMDDIVSVLMLLAALPPSYSHVSLLFFWLMILLALRLSLLMLVLCLLLKDLRGSSKTLLLATL